MSMNNKRSSTAALFADAKSRGKKSFLKTFLWSQKDNFDAHYEATNSMHIDKYGVNKNDDYVTN